MKRVLITLLGGFIIAAEAHAALPMAVEGQPLPSLAPMVERVQESIVSVSAYVQSQSRRRNDPFFNDPFFNRFFEQRRSARARTNKLESIGVIIDADAGFILTNQNTLIGATRIMVSLSDGREAPAKVVGSDKASDVAILKIELEELQAIQLGDSDALRVGDFIVSIGNPVGEQHTLTSGIISALSSRPRSRNGFSSYQNFIQTDAGYGAGILVNLRGELIGLNLSKVSQGMANSRIGFSTPVNTALKVKQHIVKYGAPQRGFLAVQVQNLTADLASAFDIEASRGVVVTSVLEGSSAQQAGLEIGDVIVRAGTASVNGGNDLSAIISQHFAGDQLELGVLRGGQSISLAVDLESSSRISSSGNLVHHRLEGASFKEVGAQQISTGVQHGVLVSRVKKGSVAWQQGVRPNDLIVSANRKPVTDMQSFKGAIAGHDVLMLNIVRGNGALFLLLQ